MSLQESENAKTSPVELASQLEWGRLEKLRAPGSLSLALDHLGIRDLFLVRRELREGPEKKWIEIPIWSKEPSVFLSFIGENEVGREILKNLRLDVQSESYRLSETVLKSCTLGISELCAPIVLRGEKIGFLRASGLVMDAEDRGDLALEERFKVLMVGPEERKKLIKSFRDLPHLSVDKRAIVTQMLELMVREIIQFFDESLTAREREEAVHKHTFNQLVTSHHPLRTILRRLNAIAESDATVLISGEPGTGRELMARMIHERSRRKDKPFKILHCSSVSENLMEAELFGYEKGAFPGAYDTKQGLLEICHGGSLFLKEIGDLSLSMQLKILRIIQDKSFIRLGSQETKKVDVRVVASTQRNLRKLVQMGAFREDLLFHLNAVELEIPPLRQRREDIALLAEAFLRQFMLRMNKEGLQWKEETLARLSSHSFPGNVRELKNEVERIVAVKDSQSFISAADLNPKISETLSPVEEIEKGRTLKMLVDEYEKQIINDALAKYNWNKSRVADLFQITRQGLLKKIAKYRLDKRKRI